MGNVEVCVNAARLIQCLPFLNTWLSLLTPLRVFEILQRLKPDHKLGCRLINKNWWLFLGHILFDSLGVQEALALSLAH